MSAALVERVARWLAREGAHKNGVWFSNKHLNAHIEARWKHYVDRAQNLLEVTAIDGLLAERERMREALQRIFKLADDNYTRGLDELETRTVWVAAQNALAQPPASSSEKE